MTKAELINKVNDAMGGDRTTKRLVSDVIQLTFLHIGRAITQECHFSFPNFGTFTKRYHKARRGVNPQTGMDIKIGAYWTVGFKPSPSLRSDVNRKDKAA